MLFDRLKICVKLTIRNKLIILIKIMTNTYSVIVNVLVEKNGRILISQRSFEEEHEPGKWTIPGGKVENTDEVEFEILQKTIVKEVQEEVGVKIDKNKCILIQNNTFRRSNGQMVLALVFLSKWLSGTARPLEDTNDVKWVVKEDINNYEFPPNVKDYILEGFKYII